MFERFTEPGIKVVVTAQEEARKIGNNFVGTEQILLGLIAETSGIGGKILRRYGVSLKVAREEIKRLVGRGSGFVAVEIPFTPRARRVLENAIEESKNLGFPYVGPEHILLGILMEDSGIAITALRKILRNMNPDITFEFIRSRTLSAMGEDFEEEFGSSINNKISKTSGKVNRELEQSSQAMENGKQMVEEWQPADIHPSFDSNSPLLCSPVLMEYTQNITQMAFAGYIDPVIGRANEVERVLQILSRRRKNNPILLGEPGVGKTAVAEGLALEIIGGYVPQSLQGKNIISLDLGLIIAGSRYRGDFEKRLKRVIADIQLTKVYILVVDEVHTLVGAGAAEGSLDAANILKPALARGEFQVIGATTLSEYRKYIETDAALARRFQSVVVKEPTVDDTIRILVGIRDKYELHHNVQVTQNALEDAVVLSSRYINDRFLPDKAIDILDEACSRVRVGYEMIPDICQAFEDQIVAICLEKEAAYRDKDWSTGLSAIREEINNVQGLIRLLYEIIDKCKKDKKIWIVRSIQQRYQFTLKGIAPLLKEWDIVLAIYENQRRIEQLEAEKNRKIDKNAPPSIQKSSKASTLIKIQEKTLEELEQKLSDYRLELKQKSKNRFDFSSVVKKQSIDAEKDEFIYDNWDDMPKSEKLDDDYAVDSLDDQEIENIEDELDNMVDYDQYEIEDLKQKFDERKPRIPKSSNPDERVSDSISNEIIMQEISTKEITFDQLGYTVQGLYEQSGQLLDDQLEEDIKNYNNGENSNKTQLNYKNNNKKKKYKINKKVFARWKQQEKIVKNSNEVAIGLIDYVTVAATAVKVREICAKNQIAIPLDEKSVPPEVNEAIQDKFFRNIFIPFPKPFTFEQRESELRFPEFSRALKFEKIKKLGQHVDIILNPEIKSDGKRESEEDELLIYTKQRKLWNLVSFIIWNPSLRPSNNTNEKEKTTSKNKTNKEGIVSLQQQKEFDSVQNQVSLETFKLHKRQGILVKLNKINLESALSWRDIFHESLIEGIGNLIIKRFGYSYDISSDEMLSATGDKNINLEKNNTLEKSFEPILSKKGKEWMDKDPERFNMNPKFLDNREYQIVTDMKNSQKNNTIIKVNSQPVPNQELQNDDRKVSKSYIPWVFASDIAGVVSDWTGVPVAKVSKNETKKLLNIEAELQKRVIGQPEAVFAIAKALRRGRVGLRDSTRPIASFFFSGPTGVGKTEVTKALAASYFGGESDMVRFDMSEFMERHTVSKLIGSPPGYVGYSEGGQLTEAVRRKPYVVVLFDEVEKAHPDVFNLLLQVLEDGRLSDSQGRVIDFKNTIIVMTSNLGASAIIKNADESRSKETNFEHPGRDEDTAEKIEDNRVTELVLEELKNFFRPEFLNRIDEIVVFRKLTKPDIRAIASIMLESLKGRLLSKSYHLLLSEKVIEKILEEGFNPDYGARPLRRVITNRLEDKLAAEILENSIKPGSAIWVDYKNDKYSVTYKNFNDTEYLSPPDEEVEKNTERKEIKEEISA